MLKEASQALNNTVSTINPDKDLNLFIFVL